MSSELSDTSDDLQWVWLIASQLRDPWKYLKETIKTFAGGEKLLVFILFE